MIDEMKNFNRRDFLKLSASGLAAAALPELTGCTGMQARNFPDIDYAAPVALTNCNVVDVVRGQVIKDRTIIMVNGKIKSIDASKPDQEGAGASISAEGGYVIPGLIDAHCHLTLQSCANFSLLDVSRYVRQIKRNGAMQVEAGVTTIRDMGSFPQMLHDLVRDYEKGSLTGPRVVYCNGIMNIDGGHPDIKAAEMSALAPLTIMFTGKMNMEFADRKELLASLKENIEGGASFIKLTMDDRSLICGRGKIPVYGEKDLEDIFSFAEKNNKPVAAHSIMHYGLKRSLQLSMHSMEHITSDTVLSDAEIRTMAEKNIAIVPTMLIGHNHSFRERFGSLPDAYKTPFIENELKIKYDYLNSGDLGGYDPYLHTMNMKCINWFRDPGCGEMAKQKKFMTDPEICFDYLRYAPDNLKRMMGAGVLIGCGTDSGVPFHYHGTLWREMEMLSRLGFKNDEILRFATVNNASILGMGGSIGSITEGKYADLVVLKENPLRTIGACKSPLLVMIGGRVKARAVPLKPGTKKGKADSYAI